MKTLILFLIVVMTSFTVMGQKKSKVDPKDAQIDSLTKVTQKLTKQSDSLSIELIKYLGLYNTIKEKVLHYDFDPTRSAFLIDSLQTSRDSAATLITNSPKLTGSEISDSVLLKEVTLIKNKIDNINLTLGNIVPESSDEKEKSKAMSSLKQLKELFDAKILTEIEFATLKKKYVDKL